MPMKKVIGNAEERKRVMVNVDGRVRLIKLAAMKGFYSPPMAITCFFM
jgi:hypothetical protein